MSLRDLYTEYYDRVQFLVVYIREAHPMDGWDIGSENRIADPQTIEEFRERERQENTSDPAAQQLDATLQLADRYVDNDGTLQELERSVDRALGQVDPNA